MIEVENMRHGYLDVIKRVRDGDRVAPRGMATRELLDVTIRVQDPYDAVPVGVGRKLNMKIGAAETVHLLAGVSDAYQLVGAAMKFDQFIDGHKLLGAYGPRVYKQMMHVLAALATDGDTRQAAVSIWRPSELGLDKRDVPCTTGLHFTIRDQRLQMHTMMRSNDVWLGVPYDFMMFTRLQLAIAWALGLEAGPYTHHVISLHVYERDLAATETLHEPAHDDLIPSFISPRTQQDTFPGARDGRLTYVRWRRMLSHAIRCVIDSGSPDKLTSTGRWYYNTLEETRTHNVLCGVCRYVLPHTEFYPSLIEDAQRKRTCMECLGERHAQHRGDPTWRRRQLDRRMRRYGLTADDYDKLAAVQDGVCGICKEVPTTGPWKNFVVDHDHDTGAVRGLLCNRCNNGLGLLGDNEIELTRALQYLQDPPGATL